MFMNMFLNDFYTQAFIIYVEEMFMARKFNINL